MGIISKCTFMYFNVFTFILIILSPKLLYYMTQTHFTTLGEEVRFDENGDPIASYDLMNWQRGSDGSLQLVRVGFYDASLKDDKDLVINEPVIMWYRGEKVCAIPVITRYCLLCLLFLQLYLKLMAELRRIQFHNFKCTCTVDLIVCTHVNIFMHV